MPMGTKKMNYIVRVLLLALLVYWLQVLPVFSQIGINTTGNNPHPSAMLDVSSTQHGILIPRMTSAERDAIKTPANGLIIYNTTDNTLNIYTINGWYVLESVSAGSTTGSIAPGGGVAINEDGSNPANVAILEVKSSNRGLLLPRTTTGSISSPSQGLIIYNTSLNKLSYYNGSSWTTPCQSFVTNTIGSGTLTSTGIAINETGNPPDQSAMLDIQSTNKGLLIPRLTDAQRNSLAPVQGLLLYNTTSNKINYWTGSTWREILNSPPTIGLISGNTTVCQGSTQTYSITPVSDASSYTWSVPSGSTITSGQGTNSINVSIGSNSGNVTVYASNGCGNSNTQSLAITVIPIPSAPTANAASSITQTSFTANWSAVTGATTYYLDVNTNNTFTGTWILNNQNVGNVTSYVVSGLVCNITYYYRVRAANSCGTSANSNVISVTTAACGPSCGTQVWMTANMNVGTRVNGSAEQNNDSQVEKYCFNDNESNCTTYGGLYQWAEAVQLSYTYNSNLFGTQSWMTCDPCGSGGRQGICPSGYHIPTDLEWGRYEWCVENNISPTGNTSLFTFQNNPLWRGTNDPNIGPGAKLKASAPAWNGTNASGFTALPAGYRTSGGGFSDLGALTAFWSATEGSATGAWHRYLNTNRWDIFRHTPNKIVGYSVRCLQN